MNIDYNTDADFASKPEAVETRAEIEVSLVWAHNHPDIVDREIQAFLEASAGRKIAWDFSRAGFLTITATVQS